MSEPLYLAFIWHMHQPYYRDLGTGKCSMPWVRLHATKDYVDMVKRLEAYPSIHQTFNIVPSLLDQLEEYTSAHHSDEFLDRSRRPAAQLTEEEQRFLLQWFFLANRERMIAPYPRYMDLLAKRGMHVADEEWPDILKRFHPEDYLDLQVWFNLTWIDPWFRHQDPRLRALEEKGSHFTEEEKCYVLEQHLALLSRVIPTYREAATRGQIELTTSPYYHPILPLLCDFQVAQTALPHVSLPDTSFRHPEEARWHLQQALERHRVAFGQTPRGLWPSEGSVSEDVARLAIEAGLNWMATDEEILWRSLKCPRSPSLLYRPHVVNRAHGQLAMVFRDRELSDLIGFVYSQWEPERAVTDFMNRLEEIRQQMRTGEPALVSIILDGENAWEYYPDDGHEFLTTLYRRLAQDERFRCVTVSEFLERGRVDQLHALPSLFSGSWIDGNFATWIGHPEKNTAWDHIAQAYEALSAVAVSSPQQHEAWNSLRIAEGSDWMWWFGDTHFSAQADEFDRLFRTHLIRAYTLAGLNVSEVLHQPIRRQRPAMITQPTGPLHPLIDGRESSYYEWLYAGRINLQQQYTAIQRGEQCLQQLYYGFDDRYEYLRIDFDPRRLAQWASWTVELSFSPQGLLKILQEEKRLRVVCVPSTSMAIPCACDRIIEVAIPLEFFQLVPAQRLKLTISLVHDGQVLERYPTQDALELLASLKELETHAWPV